MDLNNRIVISYPQGSGGSWFAHYIDCIVNKNTFHTSKTNWHSARRTRNPEIKILVNHELDNPDFNLSGPCSYNFWCYYYVKRFVHDLGGPKPRRNSNNQILRLVKCPYQSLSTDQQDFEWMFLQAKFIAQYNLKNTYNLNWQDLVYQPHRFYQTVTETLAFKQIAFENNYEFFLLARNTYLDSVRNIRHSDLKVAQHHYRIWELAYIDGVLDRAPGLDYFEYFGTKQLEDWAQQFRSRVLNETKQVYLKLS